MTKFDEWLSVSNVATILAVIVAVAGAVVAAVGHLTFAQYLDAMKWLIGLLAVGRGVGVAGKHVGYSRFMQGEREHTTRVK